MYARGCGVGKGPGGNNFSGLSCNASFAVIFNRVVQKPQFLNKFRLKNISQIEYREAFPKLQFWEKL
jgi:hypothetical protein